MIATTIFQRLEPSPPFTRLPRVLHQSTKSNVLLVDHDQQELETLSGFLSDAYQVFTATNERCVIKTMEVHSIHLIIINIELNDIDGNNLCQHLKSSANYFHIPVVLLIEGNTLRSRLKSLESGADAYIEKPFSPAYIKVQIKNLMDNRARIKNYFAHSLFAHMTTMTRSKANEVFLNKLNDFISSNLSNSQLGINLLATLMNISRPTLYRKVKCISELTPNELIIIARLNQAAKLISAGDYKILEVAKMVGYNSRSNFGKAFFKYFNVTPTAYQKLKKGVAA